MEWEKYYNEGLGYLRTANGAVKKNKLGNQVVYNVISLAIENMLTGILIYNNILPEHSYIGNMLRELKQKYQVPESFFLEVRLINKYMDFCSLEIKDEVIPGDEDILQMCTFMNDLKEWIDKQLNEVCELS